MVEIKNSRFTIKDMGCDGVLVIVHTIDTTGVYWRELSRELQALKPQSHYVYFDFLFRNGMRDRFFSARSNTEYNIECALQRCSIHDTVEKISDMFFMENMDLIERSIMTDFQKKYYIKHLHKLFSR